MITHNIMKDKIPIGISLPRDLVAYIDTKRGDVSRSKYLLRILETINSESSGKYITKVNQDLPSVHNGIDPI
jgi:hypothetical protein